MSDHHDHTEDHMAQVVMQAQARTITLQNETLRRITAAMSVLQDAALATVETLAAEAHVAAQAITALKADKAALASENAALAESKTALQSELDAAKAAAEDPATQQAIADKAQAATAELTAAVSPPAPAEPTPEPAPADVPAEQPVE